MYFSTLRSLPFAVDFFSVVWAFIYTHCCRELTLALARLSCHRSLVSTLRRCETAVPSMPLVRLNNIFMKEEIQLFIIFISYQQRKN